MKKKLITHVLIRSVGIFTLAILTTLLGKYLDNRFLTYPLFTLITFFAGLILSWVVIFIVVSKLNKKIINE